MSLNTTYIKTRIAIKQAIMEYCYHNNTNFVRRGLMATVLGDHPFLKYKIHGYRDIFCRFSDNHVNNALNALISTKEILEQGSSQTEFLYSLNCSHPRNFNLSEGLL